MGERLMEQFRGRDTKKNVVNWNKYAIFYFTSS